MNSIRHTEHDKSFRSVQHVAVASQRSCPTSFCFDDNEEAGPSDWAGTAYWTRTVQTPVPDRRSGGAEPRAKSAPQLKAQNPIQIIAAVYFLSKRERERKWRRRWRRRTSKKPPTRSPTSFGCENPICLLPLFFPPLSPQLARFSFFLFPPT